ncbi:hypothetical protein [Streptomyces sp. NBC_01465]|uniref:hypothetical protein n=1 Tax=Streptomyces sp. NBC_01465 TaxID=2903878 RepID=UPI002E30B138|nr:hypothetical protein [Streptomyces sp. NBC_01465]
MRRSTPLVRTLGSGALAASATAIALVFVRHGAPTPRLDLLGALGAALVLTAGWALACRTAPVLKRSAPDVVGGDTPAIPSQLQLPAHKFGERVSVALLALAPLTLIALATGSGSLAGPALFGIFLIITLKCYAVVRKSMTDPEERRKLRVLVADAATGEVHAVRAHAQPPLHVRYSERGSKPGVASVSHHHCLPVLHDGREIPLVADRSELASVGEQLSHTDGWLIWPGRSKLIEGSLPVAFVSDNGRTFMTLTPREELERHHGPLQPTTSSRTSQRLTATAGFRPVVHFPFLGGILLAALICLPLLLSGPDDLPSGLPWLLWALALAAIGAGTWRGVDGYLPAALADTEWTEREESDPDIT